ncbi:MAG: NAD-dependent epimerase/dehydratase family protein [Solirubrobacteraceae bacterium]
MSGERCLLTGGTGFVGGHLAERLAAEGYELRCLARSRSDRSLLAALGLEVVIGGLEDRAALERAAAGCSYVVHCAALVSDWATVAEIRQVNVEGTRNVVDAALAAGVARFVQISTTDIYGYPGAAGIDESYVPARFANWYAQSKLEAEEEVRGAAIEAVILRPATVYGPRSTDVVGEIAKAIRGGYMLLVDHGRANAGLCYIENLEDAVLLALTHPAAPGEAFNVCDGLEVTWQTFTADLARGLGKRRPRLSLPFGVARGIGHGLEQSYRVLRRATGVRTPPLLSRQAVDVLGASQAFSNRKLRERLGWEPRVDYESALAATIAWLGETRATAE